jgi:DNA-binding NarL/FixJ family response regulator
MSNNAPTLRKSGLVRLVIVDDHELARAGLRTMLIGQSWVELIGEARNGREALAICRRLHPDLALIDVRMPDMDGLATCRNIKQEFPLTSVILITMHENPQYLLEALKSGASGYVLKDITQRELLATVRRVLRGESVLNPEIVVRALNRLTSSKTPGQAELPPVQLSPREHEVLQLLSQGQTNREIARALTVSVSTVKIHVEHILAKLGVCDRTQAAVRAIELGLLEITPKE